MMITSEYVVFWSIISCVVGVGLYLMDSVYSGEFRRGWYNMTHENPLPTEEVRGFLCRRSFRTRLRAAVLIGVMGSLFIVYKTQRPMALLFLWIFVIPMVFLGFKLGPVIERLWRGRQKAMHALEKLEEEGIDFKKGTHIVVEYVQHKASDVIHHGHKDVPAAATEKNVVEPKQLPAEPEADPRALIEKFIHRNDRGGEDGKR